MIYVGDSAQGTVSVFLADGPVATATFTISGQVVSQSGAGVAGITIASRAGNVTTDANGLFTISGGKAGSFTLTPAAAGFLFSPASQTVNVTTNSVILATSFSALTTPVSITGLSITQPATLGACISTNTTVGINEPAPPSGVVITLASSNKAATIPASVTISAGATSATSSVQGNGVSTNTPVTITASYSGSLASQPDSATAGVTIAPTYSLKVESATWSTSTQILSVTATSTNAQAVLTLLLAAGNQPLGAFVNQGGGNFSIQVPCTSGKPASINIKSNLGDPVDKA
jgi:hypothetical protein